MAVGDGDNDAELLAGVGLGVAMGNATDNSRAAALVQVSDNEHDGLAEAIRRFAIASEVP
jgi:hydroxymethylpyrimidine pyrophosphatase-like HAD family hydrolase